MAVVSELVSRFSFVGSLAPQKEFNENLKLSVALLAGVGTALIGAAGGLFAFVASNTTAADALTDMNAETGIAVERIQELGYAALLTGSSQEAMTASLSGLSKVAGDAARGLGRGRKAFEDLGISVKDAGGNVKTADVLFGELSDSFRRLGTDSATQKSIIASLGLDPSTLQLLNATSEEVELLTMRARELGIVTTEQAEAAAEFQDALGISKFAVTALSQQVAVGLAPTMTAITNKFTDFLVANQDVIKKGINVFSEAILVASGFVARMTPVLGILAAGFVIAKVAALGFSGVMSIVLSPVVLITAAIVGLLLIIDDLIVAFNGGKSVIADFFQEFFGVDIVPIMQGIVDGFKWMVQSSLAILQPFFEAFSALFDAVIMAFTGDWSGALSSLLDAFNLAGSGIRDIFLGLFDFIGTAFSQILGGIKSAATSILPDWAVDLISSGGSPEAGAPGGVGSIGSGGGQDPWDVPTLTPNDAMAIGNTNNNTSSNTSNIEQKNDIKIYSNDPKQAGAAVDDALQSQMRNAKTQANRGGR